MVTLYLAEALDKGYYARKQPKYEWTFTTDITEAATYRTERGAQERLASNKHGSGHGRRYWRAVKVDGNFNILEQPPFQPFPLSKQKPPEKGEAITLSSLKKSS